MWTGKLFVGEKEKVSSFQITLQQTSTFAWNNNLFIILDKQEQLVFNTHVVTE